jgi:hypothetical protein
VARDEHTNGSSAQQADLLKQYNQAIAGLGRDELRDVLQQLLAMGSAAVDPFARKPPPSRRRPRRDNVVTYQVRIDLNETKPPVWRRLELASDLFLDDLHDVIQMSFGWTDSHLHRFGSGPDYYSPDTEYYLGPFEVEEGETGVPEEEVRLDEVLVEVGDKLLYNYDFGDDWEHTIKLEAVLPRAESVARAVCTDGRRPGPPEDCGGAHSYELIVAATDENHPRHAERAAEFARIFGDEVDPAMFELVDFDVAEINAELADLGSIDADADPDLPEPLDDLVHQVRTSAGRRSLSTMLRAAALDERVKVDVETAARMVRPYAWLLDRVGVDGIKLTSAGYLPPVHVKAAMTELGMEDEWIGTYNRESDTIPVLHLRESAQKMGLLRKYRGTLVPTPRGRALRSDPVALWWQLAERLPLRSTDESEVHAGLLLLVAVAANVDDPHPTIADLLSALGWTHGDGMPMTDSMAVGAAWDTEYVLRRLGCFTGADRIWRSHTPSADGVRFARAALSTWPAATRSAD